VGEIAVRLQTEVEDALAKPGRGKAKIKQPLGPTMLAVIAAVARLESVVSELEIRLDHHEHPARPRTTQPR
jgi:hypothetical protein